MELAVQQKLEEFFKRYTQKRYKKGEILIRQYEIPEGVFFLTEGVVRMYTISKDGEELELNIFKPYSFFPVGWIVAKTENKYYFDAVTDVVVYITPRTNMLALLKKEHDILFDLVRRIYLGLDGYFMRVEMLLKGAAYYKTIAEIVISAHRHGHHLKLTHHQIAARTGLSRETVTREIRKLQKKGIITYESEHLTILDIELLEKELAES